MNKKTVKFLSDMINSISPSGFEGPAARVWKEQASEFANKVETDVNGNSHAVINPKGKIRVMLAGHYDEIGFIINGIDDSGYIKVAAIGGWDMQIVQGQRVRILNKKGKIIKGVFGKVATHLLTPEERKKIPQISELWVDIGVKDKKEAEKLVSIGDPLSIDAEMDFLQNDLVVGRAFDNRSGAVAVLEAIRLLKAKKTSCVVHAVATSQEEIGLRGARTAAFGINPDIAIAVDVTFAVDHPGSGSAKALVGNVELGKGPVLARGPNFNEKLFDLIADTAKKEKIPVQFSALGRGSGTDANIIQLNQSGVATALISIPLRYMHTPCEVISLNDLDNVSKLISATICRIKSKSQFIPF